MANLPSAPVRLAIKIGKRLFAFRGPITGKWRASYLIAQAYWYGGHVEMDESVRFDNAVRFFGKGKLSIESGVCLGYWMAGSSTLPILLQPREPDASIHIGRGTIIVNGTEIAARSLISIGANCRIGGRSTILDADFHGLGPNERDTPGLTAPVIIEDNVWLGNEVFILKGVHIGKDAVVGARCVVTRDVTDGAIVAGNPMRIVGSVYARS